MTFHEDGSSDPDAHFRLGMLPCKTTGKLRLSMDHIRKATLLRPERIAYRSELARLCDTLGLVVHPRGQREQIRQLPKKQNTPPKRSWRFW